jgi:hypothetical protein
MLERKGKRHFKLTHYQIAPTGAHQQIPPLKNILGAGTSLMASTINNFGGDVLLVIANRQDLQKLQSILSQ